MVGNKCDSRDDPNYKPNRNRKPVDMDEAYKWFNEKQIAYIETSAKLGINVHFLFRQSHSECIPDSKWHFGPSTND